jgi:putative endonuclease
LAVTKMRDWYLYMVRCRDGTLYTGITTDIDRRLAEHSGEGDAGSKYLKGRAPLILVLQKRLGSRNLALKVENGVKKLSKAQKEKMIRVPGGIEEIIERVGGEC